MTHWVFHKELKLVQDKVIMEECWESHWELQTETNMMLMKDEGFFYHVDYLRLLGLINLMV